MNILVIGGSYFLGKAFVKAVCEQHTVTVLNRGSRPLDIKNVSEIICDRRNMSELKRVSDTLNVKYDSVVDFCAYQKGDIDKILSALRYMPSQYIFISTVDVYRRGLGEWLDELAPLEERHFFGEAGNYISGKVALEYELEYECGKRDIAYTSIRPAFIFGPENYAPREQMYFLWADRAGQIIHPSDATGVFQMVYVDDVVRAIKLLMGNAEAYNQAYNVCTGELITYEAFAEYIEKAAGKKLTRIETTVEDVNKRGLPLPFPMTKEESNWYDGSKIVKMGMKFCDLSDAMCEAFEWWKKDNKDESI